MNLSSRDLTQKSLRLWLVVILAVPLFVAPAISAQIADASPDVRALDAILRRAKPAVDEVAIDDMYFHRAALRSMRNRLAASTGPLPGAASEAPVVFWPGGVVYYAFASNVTAIHQKAFLDAAAEWTAWANLTFTAATVPPNGGAGGTANYVLVNDGGTSLSGGNSFVGVKGGQQALNIGSTSWNRGTLCHEIGHALGFIHEHQRSDRDTYVTILTQNATDGGANFVKLTDSTNKGSYDFESVMHYQRNQFSTHPNPANPDLPDTASDTIEPLPAYIQYLNLMGRETDRTLSKLDRAAIALVYGAPAIAPSATVTNTKDGGPGSLRTAVYYAFDRSTDPTPVPTTVVFHIPTTDANYSGGVFTIPLTFGLTAPGDGTTIDGSTQTAFTGDTNATGPEIFLNGAGVLGSEYLYAAGVRLRGANCTVKSLAIGNFNSNGVTINGSAATGNVVQGCYLGANAAGTAAAANTNFGVQIYGGAHGNTIGGLTAAARNVVSGNTYDGIRINDAASTGNAIQGNYIGSNAAGTAAVPNAFAGVEIQGGASGNVVGGTAAGAGNVISGNSYEGIRVNDAATTGTVIQGNLIGTNAAGTGALSNGFLNATSRYSGILVYLAPNTLIGGSTTTARNVISGNSGEGLVLFNSTACQVSGNYIGLNAAGTAALPNGAKDTTTGYLFSGVVIESSGGTTGGGGHLIGGTTAGARNVISGNGADGIYLTDSNVAVNTIQGNYIGTNAVGTGAIPNAYDGIEIGGAALNNQIGGTTPGAGNLISGNKSDGIYLHDPTASGNVIQGNFIGTNAAGTAALGNGFFDQANDLFGPGIAIFQSSSNFVGGAAAGARNVISGNAAAGVDISGGGTTGAGSNVVSGNYIGVNAAGTAALGNGIADPANAYRYAGVSISSIGLGNEVGGTQAGAGNVISGNGGQGVVINGSSLTTNFVEGNLIGLDAAGLNALPNYYAGVELSGGTQYNTVGGTSPGARNFISGNTDSGVVIRDTNTSSNAVQGNTVGLNVAGAAVTNGKVAVSVFSAASLNQIGGTGPGAGNMISGNTAGGVGIYNYDTPATTLRNSIYENSIFTNNTSTEIFLYQGANANAPAPVISSAVLGTSTVVSGTLTGAVASSTHRLEFFATPAGGTGGKAFVGSANVTTNASGAATFSALSFTPKVPAGSLLVATATSAAGNTSQFSATRAVTTTDTDGDGIPDVYETAHSLNPNSAADAAQDADGDGMTNLQEYRAGTDPRDPKSRLQFTSSTRSGSNLTLGFTSVLGQVYRLESTTDLTTSNSWRLQTDNILGTGSTIQLTLSGAVADPKRFYRLAVEP